MKTRSLLPLLMLGLCAGLASALNAQDVSAEDLQRATAHLEKTRDALLKTTAGLSDEQLSFKSSPDRWSVGNVIEHLAATESHLMGMVRNQVMQAPPRAEEADLKAIDDLVLDRIPDRSHKVQAPEPLVPNDRFGSVANARREFEKQRAETLRFLKETPNLRGHAIDSPLGHPLDAYQWLLFISAHCERHTRQIEEVKADPNFPKR